MIVSLFFCFVCRIQKSNSKSKIKFDIKIKFLAICVPHRLVPLPASAVMFVRPLLVRRPTSNLARQRPPLSAPPQPPQQRWQWSSLADSRLALLILIAKSDKCATPASVCARRRLARLAQLAVAAI